LLPVPPTLRNVAGVVRSSSRSTLGRARLGLVLVRLRFDIRYPRTANAGRSPPRVRGPLLAARGMAHPVGGPAVGARLRTDVTARRHPREARDRSGERMKARPNETRAG